MAGGAWTLKQGGSVVASASADESAYLLGTARAPEDGPYAFAYSSGFQPDVREFQSTNANSDDSQRGSNDPLLVIVQNAPDQTGYQVVHTYTCTP
jgi:hypothetical protein